MADTLGTAARGERMSRIRHRDTQPDLILRRLTYALGCRYRLHVKGLPGRPDSVFKSRRKVIFVHGCFWHQHEDGKLGRRPKSRLDFWLPKLRGNVGRDRRNLLALRADGWKTLVVWECELGDLGRVAKRIGRFLGKRPNEVG